MPRDDEVSAGQARHGDVLLVVCYVCIYPEFRALCIAGRIVALAVDAIAAAVLDIGFSRDDEAAIGQRRHGWVILVALLRLH